MFGIWLRGCPPKLSEIAGHDRKTLTAGVTGNQQIAAADDLVFPFEVILDVARMVRGALVKGKHLETEGKVFDSTTILDRLR